MNGPRILGYFSNYDTTNFGSIQFGMNRGTNPFVSGGINEIKGRVTWAAGYQSVDILWNNPPNGGNLASKVGSYGPPGSIELAFDCDNPSGSTECTVHLWVDGTLELSAGTTHVSSGGPATPWIDLWQGSAPLQLMPTQPGYGIGPGFTTLRVATIDSLQLYGWPIYEPVAGKTIEDFRQFYNTGLDVGAANYVGKSWVALCRPPMVTHWRDPITRRERLFRTATTGDDAVSTWQRPDHGEWQDAGLNLTPTTRSWAVTNAPHRCPVGFSHNGAQVIKGIGNNTRQGGVWGPSSFVTTGSLGWLTAYEGLSASSQAPLSAIHFDPLTNAMLAVGYDWSNDRERVFAMSPDNTVSVVADDVRSGATCIPWPYLLRRPDGQYECGVFVNQHFLSWLSDDGATWSADADQDLAGDLADMTAPMVAVGLEGRQVVAGFTQDLGSGSTTLVAWHRVGFDAAWQGPITIASGLSVGTRPYVLQLPTGAWEIGWQLDEELPPTRYHADWPTGPWSEVTP